MLGLQPQLFRLTGTLPDERPAYKSEPPFLWKGSMQGKRDVVYY